MRIEDFCNITDGALFLKESLQNYTRENIITCNDAMNEQLDMLNRSSVTNTPLTILGESGSGKDNIAQYAHNVSSRKNKPFFKINCAYLPEGQLSAELFGTGTGNASGLLHEAIGGSLYIENVDLLPLPVQYRLMTHITATTGSADDIRYMVCLSNKRSSTHKHVLIEQLVYYFNTMTFDIPPLRERKPDILLLTMEQLQRVRQEYAIERLISPRVMTAMLDYSWPGNIRQLTNTIDRLVFMSNDTLIDSVSLLKNCLSLHKQLHYQDDTMPLPTDKSLKEMTREYEVMIINKYIERYGSLRKAATALDTSPSVLSSKLKRGED